MNMRRLYAVLSGSVFLVAVIFFGYNWNKQEDVINNLILTSIYLGLSIFFLILACKVTPKIRKNIQREYENAYVQLLSKKYISENELDEFVKFTGEILFGDFTKKYRHFAQKCQNKIMEKYFEQISNIKKLPL